MLAEGHVGGGGFGFSHYYDSISMLQRNGEGDLR